jgi:ATP-dependent protease HslVU (ClpYQ) peptidase subunit
VTTILGVEYKNGFVIAADSQTTETDRPYCHDTVKKIVTVGDWVIAGSGISGYADVFQGNVDLPRVNKRIVRGELYKFVVSEFVTKLRQLHSECGYILKENEGFQFLVGTNNELFYISSDYSVLKTNTGLYSAGSGGEIALGAYAAGASIRQAISIAAQFDVNTGGKIQIVKRGKTDA